MINRKMKPWIFSGLIFFFGSWAQAEPAADWGAVSGEKLEFNVHWMGMPGGHAVMVAQGLDAGHFTFRSEVEAIGLVKMFHPIKDTIQANVQSVPTGFLADSFFKDQRKGDRVRLTKYLFDRKDKKLYRHRKEEGKDALEIPQDQANDPLTVLYSLRRSKEFIPNVQVKRFVLVGWTFQEVTIHVGEKERRYTPLGWFDCFAATMNVPNSDLFRQQGDLAIWFTADDRRLPIRVETKLRLGVAVAELISFEDGRGGHGSIHDGKEP